MIQNRHLYKKVKWKKKISVFMLSLTALAVIGLGMYIFMLRVIPYMRKTPRVSSLYKLWDGGNFEMVYDSASRILSVHPLQNTALAFKGYSAYYLSLAQNDIQNTEMYLDDSILSLRNALRDAKSSSQGQLKYMLGKAYYQKNYIAGYHYYADLAVRYLDEALDAGYTAFDMAEYRGLSYASLGMIHESISALTEALLYHPTDMLLKAIGEQYYRNKDYEQAQQYLFRVERGRRGGGEVRRRK